MLKRAAAVVWWAGVLVLAGFAAAEARGLYGRVDGLGEIGLMLAIGAFCTAPLWALSYVLGGTFWRPPTGPLSRPPHP